MYRDYFPFRKTMDMVYTEETDKKQTENIGDGGEADMKMEAKY